jgi:MFS family permease
VATPTEQRTVLAAGLVQGVALVTFPAASAILTDPQDYGLSSSQYGAMFLPQVLLAITASLAGAGLATRFGTRRLYLVGVILDLASMLLLLLASIPFTDDQAIAYPMLLIATACLGAGFGLTVPALNTFTAAFHAEAVDRAVLVLNALLGLGTALAPVFVAVFIGLGFWWGLPVLVALGLVILLMVSLRQPLHAGARSEGRREPMRIPARFWLFAIFAVLYGFVETMNGNWSQLDMTTDVGATAAQASLALTAFWGMVTVGRIVFAAIERRFPERRTYHLLPFVLAVAFVGIANLSDDAPWLGVALFGLAGLGCSALLPLTISFGQGQLTTISASVAGGVIASYQLGYGIAAMGTGRLLDAGVTLTHVFGFAAIVALGMGALSFIVSTRREA